MTNEIYTLIAIVFTLLLLAIVLIVKSQKQVKEDWDTYNELEKQVKAVSTKEQANSLYIKIANFQKDLHNSIIDIRLNYLFAFLDGFLKAKEND